jgi:hypothetical protein
VPERVCWFKSSPQQSKSLRTSVNASTVTLLQVMSTQRCSMEKPKRPHSLFKRPTVKANALIYYCRFRAESGDYMSPISTLQFSKAATRKWADERPKEGKIILPGKHGMTFKSFASGFWDYEGEYRATACRAATTARASVPYEEASSLQSAEITSLNRTEALSHRPVRSPSLSTGEAARRATIREPPAFSISQSRRWLENRHRLSSFCSGALKWLRRMPSVRE